jgi:hypothetical protein
VLRILVVAALAVDAVVHLRLADDFDFEQAGIGAGNLFRLASVAAILSGIHVLLRGSRAAYVVAFLVLSSAFVAVVLTRYVSVPQIGPIPPLHEPIWYPEKTLSAVAEGLGAVVAAVAAVVTRRAPRSS